MKLLGEKGSDHVRFSSSEFMVNFPVLKSVPIPTFGSIVYINDNVVEDHRMVLSLLEVDQTLNRFGGEQHVFQSFPPHIPNSQILFVSVLY